MREGLRGGGWKSEGWRVENGNSSTTPLLFFPVIASPLLLYDRIEITRADLVHRPRASYDSLSQRNMVAFHSHYSLPFASRFHHPLPSFEFQSRPFFKPLNPATKFSFQHCPYRLQHCLLDLSSVRRRPNLVPPSAEIIRSGPVQPRSHHVQVLQLRKIIARFSHNRTTQSCSCDHTP